MSYLFAHGSEVFWEGDVVGEGEDGRVVDLSLDPVHEERDVLVGRKLGRLLEFGPVLPEVLVLGTSAHHGAVGVSAGPDTRLIN